MADSRNVAISGNHHYLYVKGTRIIMDNIEPWSLRIYTFLYCKFKFLSCINQEFKLFFFLYLHAMQVKVSYKKSQVLQGLRYHFISKREIKLMIILVNVFALMAAGLFFYKKVTPLAFLLSSFLWILIMMAFFWWLPAAIYRKSATFKDTFIVSLEENHFFIDNSRGSTKTWAWREFSEMMETPNFFHLYFNPRSFFLLPKDVFRDSDELHNARVLLKEKIPQKS